MEKKSNIETETLAELYLKGDNIEKAYEIYQQLLQQNPASTRFKEKVRELELRLRESPKQKNDIERALRELREWLNRIQQARRKSI